MDIVAVGIGVRGGVETGDETKLGQNPILQLNQNLRPTLFWKIYHHHQTKNKNVMPITTSSFLILNPSMLKEDSYLGRGMQSEVESDFVLCWTRDSPSRGG